MRPAWSRRAFSIGLGLAPALGCRREAEGPESRPLSVELGVAPIVDAHPWVIAFVTEISIARPPGADARLEGRTGSGGLRHPEPIIEAETREVLEQRLASYAAERPRDPDIAPVWQPDPFGPEARVRWRLYFVDRRAGFIADAQARVSLARSDQGPRVRVTLGPEQAAHLADVSAATMDRRLAITAGDEVLALPVVAEPIEGGAFELMPSPHVDPERGAVRLLDRLTG